MRYEVIIDNTQYILNNKNFLTSGGEGFIFTLDKVVAKILLKPENAIPQKWQLLSNSFKNDNAIVAPISLVHDAKTQKIIGYTMNKIEKGNPLSLYFTQTYKQRNSIVIENLIDIYGQIRDIIEIAHNHKSLVVDGNELNYLITKNKDLIVKAIDVDSWQIDTWPSTAIKPTIQDITQGIQFTKLTDWYSFGIIMFQLFTGIHPYRGMVAGYNPKDLSRRITEHISVFNVDVKIPSNIDLSILPKQLKDWTFDEFEKGLRTEPPKDLSLDKTTQAERIVTNTGKLKLVFVTRIPGIKRVISFSDTSLCMSNSSKWFFDGTKETLYSDNGDYFSEWQGILKRYVILPGRISTLDNRVMKSIELKEQVYLDSKEGLFYLKDDKLFRIEIGRIGLSVSPNVSSVLTNASKVYNGVIYTNLYGNPLFTILRHSSNGFLTYKLQYREKLQDLNILDAWSEKNVLLLVSEKQGLYKGHTIMFSGEQVSFYSEVDLSMVQEVNATIVNGMLIESWNNTLFLRSLQKPSDIVESDIDSGIQLFSLKGKVYGWKHESIYQISMGN